jgi:Uma2 family endonuclease
MPRTLTLPVPQAASEVGPRLKRFTQTEWGAIASSGLIDMRHLEFIAGDIFVQHTPLGPQRRRWTADEINALSEAGALNVERLELIEGELYDKMGKNRPHVIVLHQIARMLYEVFGIDRVTQESSIGVARPDRSLSEPEPDLVVTVKDFRSYPRPPIQKDVCLIVEVSDTTLRHDLRIKAALYARAGIAEYWVAELNARRLVVHRTPEEGRYSSVVSYDANESVIPLTAPDHRVAVASLFPE